MSKTNLYFQILRKYCLVENSVLCIILHTTLFSYHWVFILPLTVWICFYWESFFSPSMFRTFNNEKNLLFKKFSWVYNQINVVESIQTTRIITVNKYVYGIMNWNTAVSSYNSKWLFSELATISITCTLPDWKHDYQYMQTMLKDLL